MKFVTLKFILSITIVIICCNLVTSLQSKIGMATNLKAGMNTSSYNQIMKHKKNLYSSKSNNKMTELNRLNSKILFKGWLKYFKYLDDDTQRRPKEFFKNTLFERDSKRSHAVGEEKIPSEKHFYAIMFPDSLNIYTSNNKVRIKKSFKN